MRIFKTKEFSKEARKLGISDAALCKAVTEIESGIVHAALGGEVFKQRIRRAGFGKSGGFRSILVFRHAYRTVFIDVFAKNETENIANNALKSFKQAAGVVLGLDETVISELLIKQMWIEIAPDEKDISNENVGRPSPSDGGYS
jgi:hypothetical protein